MKLHWKIIIVLIAVLLVVAGAGLSQVGTTQERAVDVYKKSLLARGEKLDISEVIPPPVAPEQNGADTFNDALNLATPESDSPENILPAMRMIAPGKAMACFTQPTIGDSFVTNSWSNITVVVEDDHPAAELLEQAASFPRLDFHTDYTRGPETLLKHLAPLKRSAQLLSTAAIFNLHNGDTAAATTDICAILGLVNAEQDDPFLISQLVRFAMAAIAANANWELLQATNVNDGELAMLQKSWERLDYAGPMENMFLMERASSEMTIHKMRASTEYCEHIMHDYAPSSSGGGSGDWTDAFKNIWADAKFGYAKSMWRATWTYSDELRMLQGDQILLETVRAIETNGSFYPAYGGMNTRLISAGITYDDSSFAIEFTDIRWMFDDSSAWATALRRTLTAQVTRNIVITAIALKRYQLKYGSYPDSLSKLIPQFLPAVLPDPIDGKPLRYRLNTDGTFLLYSIGSNDKDDGGNPALDVTSSSVNPNWLNAHALDWVWPQPATPAEIQYYYAHPPK